MNQIFKFEENIEKRMKNNLSKTEKKLIIKRTLFRKIRNTKSPQEAEQGKKMIKNEKILLILSISLFAASTVFAADLNEGF